MDGLRRRQRPRKSCGGAPPATSIRWSSGFQPYVSSKRARSPAPSPPLPRRRRTTPICIFDDDDDDDGNHDREEDERRGRRQDERGSSRDDAFWGESDADDAVEEAAGGAAAEEENNDNDDRPISVVPHHRGSTSTAPAPTPPEPSPMAPADPGPSQQSPSLSDNSSVMRNVTVENSSAFDCSICYLPLKSPIFQCTVWHVVCSPCHDKLGQATTCHVCRVPMPDGYSRCTAMEQAVDSIHIPCPHAAYGCVVKPAYHDLHNHTQTCVHKPCHCPAEGCGFASPVQATLLEHFTAVHNWPCSADSTETSGALDDVRLHKGFNVVFFTADDDEGGAVMEKQYTLVLKVEQVMPVCDTITVFCIHPVNNATVRLTLSYYGRCSSYIESVDLNANGMPGPSTCSPLFVPASAHEEDEICINVRRLLVERL